MTAPEARRTLLPWGLVPGLDSGVTGVPWYGWVVILGFCGLVIAGTAWSERHPPSEDMKKLLRTIGMVAGGLLAGLFVAMWNGAFDKSF